MHKFVHIIMIGGYLLSVVSCSTLIEKPTEDKKENKRTINLDRATARSSK